MIFSKLIIKLVKILKLAHFKQGMCFELAFAVTGTGENDNVRETPCTCVRYIFSANIDGLRWRR